MTKFFNKILFISYVLVVFALPFITASTWANMIFYTFLLSILYHLLYIIILRKTDNIKLGKSIAIYLLYLTITIEITILIYSVYKFIVGYTECNFLDFTGSSCKTYYGFEIFNTTFTIVFTPLFIIVPYQIIYIIKTRKTNKRVVV